MPKANCFSFSRAAHTNWRIGMHLIRQHKATLRGRLAATMAGLVLSLAWVGLIAVAPVAAGTTCAVTASSVSDNGVNASGTAYINCSAVPPSTDWVKGELIETLLPLAFTRANCLNDTNSPTTINCTATYYCNGSGTDEYFMKAKGRDSTGEQSVWIEGPHRNVTC